MTEKEDLLDKWKAGTLTRDDIQQEVNQLADAITTGLPSEKKKIREMLTDKDVQHIGYCLYTLYRHLKFKDSVGGFITAIASNNLYRTWRKADRANWTGISIYMEYLHQHAPAEWWK